MVVSLEEVKLYLRVDGDEENALITNFIITAEELCEGILRYSLSEFTTVPEIIKQTVLYAVSNIYEQRETFDVKAVIETMTRLLFSYRRESW
ncbi:head-tail connector protein [Clostridium tyrobutyricum]|uniref:head-tail connector protein n=1 Tax=Clostridium tyrobutyricum TaxID=1519 RepID=UPI001C383928|nr:head-tail connector protein [Clostridium tyrobutyricum]MBV4424292.1 head-tail connector protein [Clostridium tyrobutyricum]